jgi:DNA-binding transcriptional LysR family regulator
VTAYRLSPAKQARWQPERDGVTAEVTVRGRTMLNNQGLMRILAERGMGIGVLTPGLARDALASGRLVRVLPPWSMAPLPVRAVTASRLQPARVKAFVAFLADRLGG